MTRKSAVALVLGFNVLLLACDGEPGTEPEAEGWLSATVQGAETASYQGTGYFSVSEPVSLSGLELSSWFAVYSKGAANSAEAELSIQGPMDQPPSVGRHEIGRGSDPSTVLRAFYKSVHGDSIMEYAIDGGVVDITESTDQVVAGTFQLSGIDGLLCERDWPGDFDFEEGPPMRKCHARPQEERNEVTIEGTFRATRLEMCPLGGGTGGMDPVLVPCPGQ